MKKILALALAAVFCTIAFVSCGASDEKTIEVYDIPEEDVPVKVGYDCTTVPHDDTGFMDWLLDYTQGTRLGNYIMFRSFNGDVPDELLKKWGEYCKDHGMYAAACNNYLSGALAEGAGEMFKVSTLDFENLPKNEDGTVKLTVPYIDGLKNGKQKEYLKVNKASLSKEERKEYSGFP